MQAVLPVPRLVRRHRVAVLWMILSPILATCDTTLGTSRCHCSHTYENCRLRLNETLRTPLCKTTSGTHQQLKSSIGYKHADLLLATWWVLRGQLEGSHAPSSRAWHCPMCTESQTCTALPYCTHTAQIIQHGRGSSTY